MRFRWYFAVGSAVACVVVAVITENLSAALGWGCAASWAHLFYSNAIKGAEA